MLLLFRHVTPCIMLPYTATSCCKLHVVDDTFLPNLNIFVLNHVRNWTHRLFAVLPTEGFVFERRTLP